MVRCCRLRFRLRIRSHPDQRTSVELRALNCKYVTSFACYLLLLLPTLSAVLDLVEATCRGDRGDLLRRDEETCCGDLLRHDLGMPRPELDLYLNLARARFMTRMGSG